jgi:hypothetical protein
VHNANVLFPGVGLSHLGSLLKVGTECILFGKVI